MSEKRRALGRGLGALIPNAPTTTTRPVDVFFPEQRTNGDAPTDSGGNQNGTVAAQQPNPGGDAVDTGQTSGAGQDASRDHSVPVTEGQGASATDGLAPVPGASYGEVPLDEIRPNPRQPRTVFDDDDMAELVHSIREIGVLQPVVVRPISAGQGVDDDVPEGVRYELIMGERRWRASREAGRDTIPAIVKETEDDDLLRDALLENLHRSQLNPLEEAAAYQQLLEDFGCTHDDLAGRIGRSRPQISNTLRLLRLPPMVARRVAAGVLSAGHARALLSLEDGAAMERLAQRIVAEGLSVRSVEEIVALGGDQGQAAKPRRWNLVMPRRNLVRANTVSMMCWRWR